MYVVYLWIDWMCLQDDADDERGVPTSPYISREAWLQFSLRREYKSCTDRSTLHGSGHVQLPNRVLFLYSPFASRQQELCSTSRVVPGAH
jgi:hypothetical protein